MALTAILDRIRGNRRQAELTAGESYYHLVKDVASGNEVDADDAAIVIEQADKSDSDFERDVQLMGERIQAAERLRERKDAERQLAQAEKDAAAAKAKLDAALAKLRPAVDEAVTRYEYLTLEILTRSTTESQLASSVMNPAILTREAELSEQSAEVQAKLEPLERDHYRHREWAMNAQNTVDQINRSIGGLESWNNQKRVGLTIDLAKAEERLARERDAVRQIEHLLRPLQQERAAIDAERADLHRQKLIP